MLKHTGELPSNGGNTDSNPNGDQVMDKLELALRTDEEKQNQLKRLAEFHTKHAAESPAILKRLQQAGVHPLGVILTKIDAYHDLYGYNSYYYQYASKPTITAKQSAEA